MDIDGFFEEIRQEIQGCHEYLALREEQGQTQINSLLTVVATLGLVLGLASGILGMNVLIEESNRGLGEWTLGVSVLVFCFAFMWVGIRYSKPIAAWIRRLAK